MIRLFSLVLGSGLKPPTGRPSSFQSKGAGGDFCRRMGGVGMRRGGKRTDGPRKAILLATLVFVSSLYSLFLILLYWGIRRSNFCMCKPHLNEWEDVVAMKRERGRSLFTWQQRRAGTWMWLKPCNGVLLFLKWM
ncbi:hypothetical protein PVAP13_9NG523300 [Panicum virgatum]|uniref:Transmembrane protein n=1 Tax=Panicum virgatum TaxID=38727 RepID=A0A8T0MUL5_PANVG|nr:hypothetical protein PVAP13_9NG523300 [Panicum virgatum]